MKNWSKYLCRAGVLAVTMLAAHYTWGVCAWFESTTQGSNGSGMSSVAICDYSGSNWGRTEVSYSGTGVYFTQKRCGYVWSGTNDHWHDSAFGPVTSILSSRNFDNTVYQSGYGDLYDVNDSNHYGWADVHNFDMIPAP